MTRKYKIAVLKGDGIGPEVVTSAKDVLGSASRVTSLDLEFIDLPVGMEAYNSLGRTLPPDTLNSMKECDGFVLGPLQTGNYPKDDKDYPLSSGKIRKYFDLFANIRPAKSIFLKEGSKPVDLVIVRENTEDFFPNVNLYKGYGEFWTDKDTVVSLRVIRRSSCRRIAKVAFELARARGNKKLVTAVHKSNVLMEGDGLFLEEVREAFREEKELDPELKLEEKIVDTTAMELVSNSSHFDIVLATNMFGDILSDEAAGLIGGLGLCPSLNSGDNHAMAQAVHGTAPDIAGKGVANPISEILSGVMLLDWLFSHKDKDKTLFDTARVIENSLLSQLASGDIKERTSDLGGNASTRDFTHSLVRRIESKYQESAERLYRK